MTVSAADLFSFAQQYATLAGADFCDGLRAVEVGNNRAEAVGGPGDEYLLLTPSGWVWETEPAQEEEYTDTDRWESEMESRRENRHDYA